MSWMQNFRWKKKKDRTDWLLKKDKYESEKEMKQKELEVKMALEQAKLNTQGSSSFSTQFDTTKNIRLVPKFEEKKVDKYFLYFDKIAESLKWPK